ncbi:hypothetical protein ACFU99_05755 [Streptomyces sp. NPDC057654]|uniref:hypothetical protein n=1 Tax=Streptomyces sp. NPDC057654 TaxID=3346196 RepID=UPI003693335C
MTAIPALIADLLLTDAASKKTARTVTAPELPGVAEQLPQLEWCPFCSYDETGEPGMPRDIVKCTVEPALPPENWSPDWGQGPLYQVTCLSCGHTLAKLCEPAAPRSTHRNDLTRIPPDPITVPGTPPHRAGRRRLRPPDHP